MPKILRILEELSVNLLNKQKQPDQKQDFLSPLPIKEVHNHVELCKADEIMQNE